MTLTKTVEESLRDAQEDLRNALETVRKSLENCEQLCGLDKKTVAMLLKGEFNQYETLNSVGRSSKIIKIEYDIKERDQGSP